MKHADYSVREMAETLLGLTDEQFGYYAFLHEPLEGKFSDGEKANYIKKANECGRSEAQELASGRRKANLRELADKLDVTVVEKDIPAGGGHVVFAQYEEPNRIVLFTDCIDKTKQLLSDGERVDLFGDTNLIDILLAHELFHVIEHKKKDEIFTQTEEIELWKVPFSNKSRILALSEIAAMAFAEEICDLSFSPYVLDVLLVAGYSKDAACALYEEILYAADLPIVPTKHKA